MRHTVASEQLNEVTEIALHRLGEQRVFGVQRGRLLKIVAGLEDASRIDLERARNRVARARAELRDAEEECSRVQETNGHETEVLAELAELSKREDESNDAGEREIATVAAAAGYAYAHPDLLEKGGVKALVERRRRVRAAGASKPEADVV